MPSILHVEASPRKQRSASREIAQVFINAYIDAHPGTQVMTLDLWTTPLPEFCKQTMDAKYADLCGMPLTEAQEEAWDQLRELAGFLHAADVLVFSIPMWNFSIPYKLKHFIDLVSQKGILFSFDPKHGFSGLLRNKKAFVTYARGLDFSPLSATPASAYDHQSPFFEKWLNFVGVEDVQALVIEKTLYGEAIDRAFHDQLAIDATRMARRF
ncbi:MAG TPA: NAD(P)H-dependent oxidoreductase [Noviherbaspirillum sp.]|nr:NAD(P)H-dependent oxidoreductase [Noviherbaspirillum sp.]